MTIPTQALVARVRDALHGLDGDSVLVNADLTLAAKNVLLTFHDWPWYQSSGSNGERHRALSDLNATLLPPEDSTDAR